MSKSLSVLSSIERGKLSSDKAFLVCLNIAVVNPADFSTVETLRLVRNTEDITYNGNVYTAAAFDISLKAESGSMPSVTLSIEDHTRSVQARMQAYQGGVGFKVDLIVVNSGDLSQPPEIVEYFEVVGASAKDYVATFTLGAENVLASPFPGRRQTKRFCQWKYKGPQCGYRDEQILSLPGTTGNYASTPDTAGNSVTGDIDIRVKAFATDWTPASVGRTLFAKFLTTGNQRSWLLSVLTTGHISLTHSPDGTASLGANSTAVPAFTDGQAYWIRVTLDVDNGAGGRTARFYTSTDYEPYEERGAWVELGTAVTTAGTTSIFNSTQRLEVGSFQNGGASSPGMWSGGIHYAELRNGINGTVVARFDARDLAIAATSGPSLTTGEVWTVNQSGSPVAQIAYATGYPKPTCDLTLKGDNGCAAHNNSLNFGGFPGLNNSNNKYG